MVLDRLSTSLKDTLKKIARAIFVDEKLIDELIKDLQRALLQADVNVQLVFDLTKKIKERALDEKTPSKISQKEHLINIVYEELVNFLGEEKKEIKISQKPTKIMLMGLLGSGKTTSAGKVARYFKNRGNKVGLIQLDVYRPSSLEQLQVLGKSIDVDVFGDEKEKNPLKIYKKFEDELKKYDLVIIDTAGRHALDKELIKEIEELNKYIKPEERLLVLGADIGQGSKEQAEQFHKSCSITGIIVTKMDGTAKGGGALTGSAVSGAPIKFVGTGEKIDDLEEFNPKGFVGRLLGMGDLEALLEKTKHALDEEKTKTLTKNIMEGRFDLIDLYEQMNSMSKLGPLSKIIEMIPGFGNLNIPKEALSGQEEKLGLWKNLMNSMTKEELENPDIIDGSRSQRIATGSGTKISDVRELLKQYKQSKKIIKMMSGSQDPSKLMKKFKGKLPKGFKI
ncbi:signal recognition particle protein [Candidatus Woesearchaeota archaeon]|nr:signal recognition particle protein [Candidatus Woesearchaeota archaeon]